MPEPASSLLKRLQQLGQETLLAPPLLAQFLQGSCEIAEILVLLEDDLWQVGRDLARGITIADEQVGTILNAGRVLLYREAGGVWSLSGSRDGTVTDGRIAANESVSRNGLTLVIENGCGHGMGILKAFAAVVSNP